MNVQVKYAANLLAGTGKIKLENRIANVFVENTKDDKSIYSEILDRLSVLDELPRTEFKILSISEL